MRSELKLFVVSRGWQVLLIVSTLGLSWLAMMAVHEFGHVLHAWLSGGAVQRVELPPLAISRTDVSPNPRPLFVAWGGAVWGAAIPFAFWLASFCLLKQYRYLFAFFAGFCCLANGLYLAVGSFTGTGDAGDLLRHGALQWQLMAFGIPLAILGLWLWNGLGPSFGIGSLGGVVDRAAACGIALLLVVFVGLLLVLEN